jgi:hypothetical protein
MKVTKEQALTALCELVKVYWALIEIAELAMDIEEIRSGAQLTINMLAFRWKLYEEVEMENIEPDSALVAGAQYLEEYRHALRRLLPNDQD